MSKPFLYVIIALLTAGLAFFVWLHYAEVRDWDRCHEVVAVKAHV